MNILVLDDQPHGASIVKYLSKKGFSAEHVRRGSDAIDEINKQPRRWSAIVVDLHLAPVDGLPLDDFMGRRKGGLLVLERLRSDSFRGKAIVLSVTPEDCSESDCRRLGITARLGKRQPYGTQMVAVELVRVLYPALWQERQRLIEGVWLNELPDLQPVLERIKENAYFDRNTLLVGEPGVGKEALCRYFFVHSGRLGTFVSVPGASLAGDGMRVTLCGQAQGFPQPNSAGRPGMFELAGFGVVYIGELDKYMESQGHDLAPLYTATDERYVCRVGGTANTPVQCAIVASANGLKHIGPPIQSRFNIIKVPPLRERPRDIAVLAKRLRELFLDEYVQIYPSWEVTDQRIKELQAHPLPGNIRSLNRWAQGMDRPGPLDDLGGGDTSEPTLPQSDAPNVLTLTVKLTGGKAAYSDYFGNRGDLKGQYWIWLGSRVGFKLEELQRASGQSKRDVLNALKTFELPLDTLDEDQDDVERGSEGHD